MYKSEVIQYFNGVESLRAFFKSRDLKISQPAISKWGEIIPEKQALRLEKLTGGQLKYDPTLYRDRVA